MAANTRAADSDDARSRSSRSVDLDSTAACPDSRASMESTSSRRATSPSAAARRRNAAETPPATNATHPRRRRQPGPLFFDDVGGLARGERQRDPGGQAQSRITDRDDLGRLHSAQRTAAGMRRRRRRIALCRNENGPGARIGDRVSHAA
ncbi:hypothetical protein [Gordonia sputi]